MAAAERTTGVLVRVGADTSCGGVNSPIRTATGEFVYVPVPERTERVRNNFERSYSKVAPHVHALVGGVREPDLRETLVDPLQAPAGVLAAPTRTREVLQVPPPGQVAIERRLLDQRPDAP
jgi:hypothetical protein